MEANAIERHCIRLWYKDFRDIDSALNWRNKIIILGEAHQRRANHTIAVNDFVFRNHNVIKDHFTGASAGGGIDATLLDSAAKLS